MVTASNAKVASEILKLAKIVIGALPVKTAYGIADYSLAKRKARQQGYNIGPVFHGSPNTFSKFDPGKIGMHSDSGFLGRGFYFSTDINSARTYGKPRAFFLKLKNPQKGSHDSGVGYVNALHFSPSRQDGGLWVHEDSIEYVVADPDQIKSMDEFIEEIDNERRLGSLK